MTVLFAQPPPTPKNETQAAHVKLYTHLRDSEVCTSERAYLADAMQKFEQLGLADPDFIERFPLECGARIWELRLATIFASWGWKLIPAKTRGVGPDFGIEYADGSVMWVEATAPSAGAEHKNDGGMNRDKVRVPTGQVVHGTETDRTIMLRYLGAISEKRKQWERSIESGAVDKEDGFTIAISGALIPDAWFESEDEMPRVVRTLFGVGAPFLRVPLGGAATIGGFTDQGMVLKTSGAEVPSRIFLDGDCAPEISAVVFSPSYLKERPEKHGHPPGWDFIFALNAHARRAFPFRAPKTGRVFFLGLQCDDRRR